MEEDELCKNTTSNAWNVALNVKTEMNAYGVGGMALDT